MSGSGRLYPLPAFLNEGAVVAGNQYEGIPALGLGTTAGAPTGVPAYNNLLSGSPPTLLEEFEVVAFSLPFGMELANNVGSPFASAPVVNIGINLLHNDDVAYSISQQLTLTLIATTQGVANGIFQADLVNPVRYGARSRLGIQVFFTSNEAASLGGSFLVAANWQAAGAQGQPASISYNVIDLPASRRL